MFSLNLTTLLILRLTKWLSGEEFVSQAGDLGLIPRLGRSPGEGKGYPLQCSALENSMDCIGSDTTDYIHLSLVTPVPTCS